MQILFEKKIKGSRTSSILRTERQRSFISYVDCTVRILIASTPTKWWGYAINYCQYPQKSPSKWSNAQSVAASTICVNAAAVLN